MSDDALRLAVTLAKTGDKVRARRLVESLIEAEPNNEGAWMLLADLSESGYGRQICLEKILLINPGNTLAQEQLEAAQNGRATEAPLTPSLGIPTQQERTPLEVQVVRAQQASIQTPVLSGTVIPYAASPAQSPIRSREDMRKAVTWGVDVERGARDASGCFMFEAILISVALGFYFKSWWIFGAGLIGSSLLFVVGFAVRPLGVLLSIALALGWGWIGWQVGSWFGSEAAWVFAVLAFFFSLMAHLAAVYYWRQYAQTQQ